MGREESRVQGVDQGILDSWFSPSSEAAIISLENATVCLRCLLFQLSQGFAQPSIVTMLESVLLSVLQIATAKGTESVVVTAADAFADGQCIKVLCRLLSLCFSLVCLYPVRKLSEKSSDIFLSIKRGPGFLWGTSGP